MARLGELLVATGLLTVEQVEQALRAQVMWGGRLGTNLIELGYLDLETLSQHLARLRKVPAAYARHFEKADRVLQQKLSVDVAERFSVVPLMEIGPQKFVVFASTDPIDKRGLALIADELAITTILLIPSIAPELRIRYHLERVYKIPRGTRFLRSRGKTIPPFPQFEIAPLTFEDSEVENKLPSSTAELPVTPAEVEDPVVSQPDGVISRPDGVLSQPDGVISQPDGVIPQPDGVIPRPESVLLQPDGVLDVEPDVVDYSALAILEEAGRAPAAEAVPAETYDEPSGRDRRKYVRTIADEPSSESERQAVGRIAIRRVAIAAAAAGATLGEATRAIRRSTDRDKVGDLVMSTLERFLPTCEAAILLVLRGGVAIGWKGFSRSSSPLPEIAVPLEKHGLIPRAVQRGGTVRAAAIDLIALDRLLLGSLGHDAGDLVVVPVTIAEQVMCLIALVTSTDAPVDSAESIAAAAGAAFARLMRDASR